MKNYLFMLFHVFSFEKSSSDYLSMKFVVKSVKCPVFGNIYSLEMSHLYCNVPFVKCPVYAT